jgi:hypothetical protein
VNHDSLDFILFLAVIVQYNSLSLLNALQHNSFMALCASPFSSISPSSPQKRKMNAREVQPTKRPMIRRLQVEEIIGRWDSDAKSNEWTNGEEITETHYFVR